MTDEKNYSLISFGDIGKFATPVNTLVEKISAGIGGFAEPWQIKRVAEAKAEASITEAKAQIEVTDLHRRAMYRWVEEEARNQNNMENIAKKSFPHVTEDAKPENMEKDWITNFFAKARFISDEGMQQIWAGILAGEANNPNSFSKRTVNVLADLDKQSVLQLEQLCRFAWNIEGNFVVVVFDVRNAIYNNNGVDFSSVMNLSSLGLLQNSPATGFVQRGLPEYFSACYAEKILSLKAKNNEINAGIVLPTNAGHELARLTNPLPVDGFYEYAKEQWRKLGYIPPDEIK